MADQESVYILIPVHNRRFVTLQCLANLHCDENLNCYQFVVIDDGSTDGTSDAVKANYPEVTVLAGNGNLWWTGAIRKGMEYAISQGAGYIIWLNDDCLPQAGAIAQLLKICQTNPKIIVGGQAIDPDTQQPSYGGVVSRTFKVEKVNAKPQQLLECDGLNGNLVCMPASVVKTIGYPNYQRFPHYHADTTYTHFAKQNGYRLLLCGDTISFCRNDNTPISWLSEKRSAWWLLKQRFTIKSPHYWKAHLGFYQELLGLIGVGVYVYEMIIKFSLISLIKVILPYHYQLQLRDRVRRQLGSR